MARVSRASAASDGWSEDRKVLIVDDEVFVRNLIKRVVNRIGILLTVEAADTATARAGLERFQPDVVILDINMPGETGLHLLQAVRSGETVAKRDLPVIILTSLGGDEILSAALELDANAFVSKGEGFQSLADRLRRAVLEPIELAGAETYAAVDLAAAVVMPSADETPATQYFDDGLRATADKLVPGKQLPADLLTQTGQRLLTKGTVITDAMCKRISDIEETFGLRWGA